MDEPLSNLDAKLRVQMRSEVARIQHELKATTVYVTHDQVEAMTMGDRVALMRRGVLQQVDTPMRLYNAPANLFVASFIGSPAMNLFEAQLERSATATSCAQIGDQFLRLEPEALAEPGELERYAGRTVALGIRPEHLEDATVETGAPSERRLRATVKTVEALGAELIAHLEIAGRPVLTDEVKEVAADLDEHDRCRARGRGARRQAPARRPLRRRLARARRRSRSRSSSTRAASTSSTSTPARPSAGTRSRGSEPWPPPPSGARATARPQDEAAHRALQRRGADRAACSCCRASIGFVVFYAYPALRGFYLSFTDFDLLRNAGDWVGLDNYQALLQDALFWNALWITFKYVIINIGIQTDARARRSRC